MPLPPSTAAGPRIRAFDERRETYEGWEKFNSHYWLEHYEDFLEFFFGQMLHRAALHQADRGLHRLGPGTDPETLIATTLAALDDQAHVLAAGGADPLPDRS